MRFSTTTILFSAVSVFGQTVITPTPGQVLTANQVRFITKRGDGGPDVNRDSQPFNLTFASQRYFKESSLKISVVTAPIGGAFPGGAPVIDLAPTSYDSRDSAIYSVMVNPITLYSGDPTGNHTVYVIETYSAFGGNPGIDMFAVPVTFV
ncbi:hypothetical protein B0H13DRAFT_1899898 [Mycena leptocephala]|nr:hypothetical protein B0H13DRAFT_1899898 [Mycena leptocephala]